MKMGALNLRAGKQIKKLADWIPLTMTVRQGPGAGKVPKFCSDVFFSVPLRISEGS